MRLLEDEQEGRGSRPAYQTLTERDVCAYRPRTALGRQLWEIRRRIAASGQPLLGWEEIERLTAESRGEYDEGES